MDVAWPSVTTGLEAWARAVFLAAKTTQQSAGTSPAATMTYTDASYQDAFANWMHCVTQVARSAAAVIALDELTAEYFHGAGAAVIFAYDSRANTTQESSRAVANQETGGVLYMKGAFTRRLLDQGLRVIFFGIGHILARRSTACGRPLSGHPGGAARLHGRCHQQRVLDCAADHCCPRFVQANGEVVPLAALLSMQRPTLL